ncbi:MAG: ArnT family glycosyltransferase [Thermoanaerobaculaceae bacterium]
MPSSRLPLAVALTVLIFAAAAAPLVDRDEPRYAQAVREMRATGDLFVPRNFGALRPDKPILIYWLQLGSTAVLGEVELGFRLPSLLAMGLWLWATAGLCRELGGKSQWILLPGMALAGLYATPDALVGALVASSLWAFVRAVNSAKVSWSSLGWVLLGLGILAKGPVAPLFVFSALGGYCGRDRAAWQKVIPWWGPLLAATLVGAWVVPAGAATDWVLIQQAIKRHLLERSIRPLEGHGLRGLWGIVVGPPFYLASLALASWPLAFRLRHGLREAKQSNPRLWRMVVWGIALPLLVLSFIATKLPHYILPAVPLIVAAASRRGPHCPAPFWISSLLALIWVAIAFQAPYRKVAEVLQAQGQSTFAFAPQEPSLRFYAGAKLQVGKDYRGGFSQLLLRPGEEERLQLSVLEHLQLTHRFSGWNLAKGRKETLLLYRLAATFRE